MEDESSQVAENTRPEDTSDATAENEETVKLILEHRKDDPRDQLRDSDQLDTKVAAVFTAATVVVGFAVRLPQTETSRLPFTVGQMTPDPMVVHMSLVDVLVWLVAACWAVAAFNVVRHLRTRRYSRPLETGVLWEKYRHRRPEEVRKILVRDIARADKHNREILAHKAHLLNAAVLATGLESLFLVIAVILTR